MTNWVLSLWDRIAAKAHSSTPGGRNTWQMSFSPICTPTNISTSWGNPEGFLLSLAGSGFIHVVDQYAQRYDSNQYTNGADPRFHNSNPALCLLNSCARPSS